MSMEMTWLDFQLSTDNQNGRHLATFFFRIPSKHGIGLRGLRVYQYCPFSCETENEAVAAILFLSILMNRSHFQINALKPGIYSHRISRWLFEWLYGIFFLFRASGIF